MAKAKKNQEEAEVIESPVKEVSKFGVDVYEKGQHPRNLRRAAEAKAEEASEEVETPEEETPDEVEE